MCNKNGSVTFKCVATHESGIECTAVIENVKINRTNQHITYVVDKVEPTCTEKGMEEYYVCTMCNRSFSVPNAQGNTGAIGDFTTIEIDATGHNMSDYTRVEGMGCGVENNMISVCENGCGHSEYATEDHDWSAWVRLPNVGCGTADNISRECALCGDVEKDTQGHNYVEASKTETVAYCEKTVVKVETCEHCGDTITTTTVEVCHNEETLVAVKVTCVTDGLTEGKKCADCGETLVAQEVISAAELHAAHEAAGYHTAGSQAQKFPTCTEVGYTTGTKCTECDVVVVAPVELPATGHTYNTVEIPATCQTEGYRVGGICENEFCGYVVPGKTIAKVDCVAKEEKVLVSEANCASPAIYNTVCKWCGELVEENVAVGEKNPEKHIGTVAIDPAYVAADCENDGYAYYKCSDCEFIVKIVANTADKAEHAADGLTVMTEDEFNAAYPGVLTFKVTKTGHKWSDNPTRVDDATCTAAGNKLWICQNTGCGETKNETIPAKGHTDATAVKENIVAPQCEVEGTYDEVVYCAVCEVELTRTPKTTPATGHTPGRADRVTEPTCTTPGSTETKCTVCSKVVAEGTIDPHGHGEYVFQSTTATCTTAGVETYACEYGCGDTKTQNVEPYNHREGSVVVENNVDPTCTVSGSYDNVIRCTVCNKILHSETVIVPANGHTAADAVVEGKVDPTCVNDGTYYSVVYCSVCDEELSRDKIVTGATGHTASDAVRENVTEATCTSGGYYEEVVYCSVCDAEISRDEIIVDALGHTPADAVEEPGQDSTCTEPGYYYNVVYCSTCGEEIDRTEQPIEPKGHVESSEYIEFYVAPTCTETGSYDSVYYCTVDGCGAELSRETITVDALEHKFVGYQGVVTVANCENLLGEYVLLCSRCDVTTETEEVAYDMTKGHGTLELVGTELVYVAADGEFVPHVNNICQEGTVGGWICGVCEGEIVTDPNYADKAVGSKIPASHDATPEVHDATCMTEGYIEMICDCGYKYVIDESYYVADMNDKSVHTLGGYVIKVQASCDNPEGSFVQTCADCGKTFETKVTYDLTKGHGYISAYENGAPVYTLVSVTVVPHVSNVCQEGTVGGEYCTICDYIQYTVAEYADKAIGSKIKPSHNMRADAQAPSCEGIGVEGWTYHEYCVDCGLGHTPETVIPCTPCVVVTVPYKAPTCTEAGNNEYSYNACCATKAEVAAIAAAAKIAAAGHTAVTYFTADATCTTPMFEYTACGVCHAESTFTLVQYYAPLGHNVVSADNGYDATCTVDGKESDKICDRCHAESTKIEGDVIPATGHVNAAGDKFLDTDKCSADALGNDRHCVACDTTIDFVHRFDTQISSATCKDGEIRIDTCVDCNTQKELVVVRGPWTEEEHREAILATTPVVTPATPTEYGKEVYTCPHCGETVEILIPLAGGIEFELDYNVVYPVYNENGQIVDFVSSDRKETANGTWIAVDVLVYGNKDFHFSQIDVTFNFNSNVVYFGSNFETGVENFVVESVLNSGNAVTIAAGIAPNAAAPYTFVDTVGEDAEGVVLTTVYFMVAPEANVGEASFSFGTNNGVYLVDADETVANITMFATFDAEAMTFTSKVLGDYTADGVINGAELLYVKQMINGKLDATYDVTLDLNKDGEVTVVDYEIFKALVNYSNTFVNEAYTSVASR